MIKKQAINRRDFLIGTALAAGLLSISPAQAIAEGLLKTSDDLWTYPPLKTGMRGAHPGSFEKAHDYIRFDNSYKKPKNFTDKPYDLVIVGGGLSGLTAAVLAKRKLGANARILVLDNHDDFGGHAKRNEFKVGDTLLIGHGGSQSIDTPSHYSAQSSTLLQSLGVDVSKFYRYYDRSFFKRHGLSNSLCLTGSHGKHELLVRKSAVDAVGDWAWSTLEEKADVIRLIHTAPLSDGDKEILHHLVIDRPNWLPSAMTPHEQKALLGSHSFKDCLVRYAGISETIYGLIARDYAGVWGVEWDSIPALEAVNIDHPFVRGLDIWKSKQENPEVTEPYIFHFPDGNASIARLLVGELRPDVIAAHTMDDIVKAHVHYDRLDRHEDQIRIRLLSTALDVRNRPDGSVTVTYARGDTIERVVGAKAIMACNNRLLPMIMPELPDAQKEALLWPEKTPLTYINVALTNWRALKMAGVKSITKPDSMFCYIRLDYPVSMGGYTQASHPDEPIIIRFVHVPTRPGLTAREQFRMGRADMLGISLADYEDAIKSDLNQALGPYGFNVESDIAAITVNRWPHGYAYEYNPLFDPPHYSAKDGPHVKGRAAVGSISIANADSEAYAYVDAAMDAAFRAVQETLG